MPEAEGALVSVQPGSGEVRALVGGFDFSHNQFNHATQGWRQPGVQLQALVIYAGALDHGVMPDTIVNDAPITVGDWSPSNSDGSLDGPITLKTAARSKNLVTIRLVAAAGRRAPCATGQCALASTVSATPTT